MNGTTDTNDIPTAADMAADTMLGDLMGCVVDELRNTEKPWQAMSEDDQQRVVYAHRATAERRVRLLTGSEPWKEYGRNAPDEYYCCDGYQCGCDGLTVREHAEATRAALPPLEYVRIEERQVGAWAEPEQPNTRNQPDRPR